MLNLTIIIIMLKLMLTCCSVRCNEPRTCSPGGGAHQYFVASCELSTRALYGSAAWRIRLRQIHFAQVLWPHVVNFAPVLSKN